MAEENAINSALTAIEPGSGDLWPVAVFPSMLFLLRRGIELLPKVWATYLFEINSPLSLFAGTRSASKALDVRGLPALIFRYRSFSVHFLPPSAPGLMGQLCLASFIVMWQRWMWHWPPDSGSVNEAISTVRGKRERGEITIILPPLSRNLPVSLTRCHSFCFLTLFSPALADPFWLSSKASLIHLLSKAVNHKESAGELEWGLGGS